MKAVTWYLYKAASAVVRLLYPAPEFSGLENLPKGCPCIIVGNHAHTYGPFYMELYLPCERAIWCIGEIMDPQEAADYAFKDFWSRKPLWCRWVYRLLSYVFALLSVAVLKHAHCIGVYKDSRLLSTMRESIRHMKQGDNIVIFPEHEVTYNDIVWEFQQGFVDLAAVYTRQTGEPVDFVPMYIAPKLKRVCLGKPIAFDPKASLDAERDRVCHALMDEITDMARDLPPHVAVPYPNLPRHMYNLNRVCHNDEE